MQSYRISRIFSDSLADCRLTEITTSVRMEIYEYATRSRRLHGRGIGRTVCISPREDDLDIKRTSNITEIVPVIDIDGTVSRGRLCYTGDY